MTPQPKFALGQQGFFYKERKICTGMITYIRMDIRASKIDVFYHVNTETEKVFVRQEEIFPTLSSIKNCLKKLVQ